MNQSLIAQVNFDTLKEALPVSSLGLLSKQNLTLGLILTTLVPYLFVLAGLLLFVYLALGGFQLMLSRGEPKAVESAKGKITNAILGFIIIFASFWIVQILQKVFGLGSIFG